MKKEEEVQAKVSDDPPCACINVSAIPEEMRKKKRWCNWRYIEREGHPENPAKLPLNSNKPGEEAKSNDPETWGTFEEAIAVSDQIGYFLDGEETCLDYDGCRDAQTGVVAPGAYKIVIFMNSYTEISPSGKGLHTWVIAELPDKSKGRRRHKLEIYNQSRFICVTGNHLEETPLTLESRQAELNTIYQRFFPPKPVRQDPQACQTVPISISDSELLRKASKAKNGSGEAFDRLYRGDISDYDNDPSRADQALASRLAFWTGRDSGRMDALFRQSGLMRSKWDSARGDSTYGQITVDNAIASCTQVYTPPKTRAKKAKNRKPKKIIGCDPETTGELLADLLRDHLVYDVDAKQWLRYEGHSLKKIDERLLYTTCSKALKEEIQRRIDSSEDDNMKDMLEEWKYRCSTIQGVKSALTFALGHSHMQERHMELNDKPHLVAFTNGVFDLTDGSFRDGCFEDLLTINTGYDYDPDAKCPTFEKAWRDWFPEEAIARCLHRAFGYAITGYTKEKMLGLIHGESGSGKTVLVETILAAAGDYGRKTSIDVFSKQRDRANSRDYRLAKLEGIRFAAASEPGVNCVLDEDIVKEITGRETIEARNIYEAPIVYKPQVTPFLATNDLPVVPNADPATLKRLFVIKQDIVIGQTEKDDKSLQERLLQERQGVMNWLLEGAVEWFKHGLGDIPEEIRYEMRAYRDEQDHFSQFLDAWFDPDADAVIPSIYLLDLFKKFLIEHGETYEAKMQTSNGLGRKCTSHGLLSNKITSGSHKDRIGRRGYRLKPHIEQFLENHNYDFNEIRNVSISTLPIEDPPTLAPVSPIKPDIRVQVPAEDEPFIEDDQW
jgi:putative DNA primase/helicase